MQVKSVPSKASKLRHGVSSPSGKPWAAGAGGHLGAAGSGAEGAGGAGGRRDGRCEAGTVLGQQVLTLHSLLVQKYKYWRSEACEARTVLCGRCSPFTCFTGTKVPHTDAAARASS
jgi:hypothetical protein